jgi:serine/threonine protein kinase
MPASLDCPQADCWDALFGDTIAPDQRERYERHLESCPFCQERLDRSLEGREDLVGLVRQVGDPTTRLPEPALARALDHLHEVRSPLRTMGGEPDDLYFLRPSDQTELLGTLGQYEVREVIGQGGMGVVLKAYDPALQRLVAIKVMAAAVAGSATARRRFTREAQAAAAVCHDHVVTVHGVHEADGLPYLVMQYIAGESLQARIDRTGPLELVEVVRIGMQTASGLAAAHAQGLIHRDIKPANLLLENGLARVKITDFGLARMVDDVGLTQNGVVTGTPEYMAPEQARGEPVDHRADLFSLGSVLYAMCTGRPPFRGSSAVAVLRQVSDEEPLPVRFLNSDIPVWLETVVMRLMAKHPASRFQSAAEVATLLEGYLAHLRQPTTIPAPELSPLPERRPASSPPGQGSVKPWGRRFFWIAVALGALMTGELFRWFLGAGDAPGQNQAPREFYHDFRGKQPAPSALSIWTGKDGDETVDLEEKGLRITLPRGRARTDPVGPVMNTVVKGNFEIAAGYELLQADTPKNGYGVGFELYIMAATDAKDAIAYSRVRHADGNDFYVCNRMTTVDGKRKYTMNKFPTDSKSGRLRLTRRGGEVTYWVAEGDAGGFKELCRHGFVPDEVRLVRTCAYTGTAAEPVDLRIVDVKVRSDAPLPDLAVAGGPAGAPASGMKKGVALIVALGLALTVALAGLGVWFFLARRGRGAIPVAEADSENGEAVADGDSPFVSFACPKCGANVKARSEQAGLKGKCPRCGKAVLVPGAGLTTRPEGSPLGGPAGSKKLLDTEDEKPFAGRRKKETTSLLKRWWFYVSLGLLLVLLLASAGVWFLWPRSAGSQTEERAEKRSFLDVTVGYTPDPDIEESGFSFPEFTKGQPFRWTDGHGRLVIPLRKGEVARALEVKLGAYRLGRGRVKVKIALNEKAVFDDTIPQGSNWEKTFDLVGIDLGAEAAVDITSDTFAPLGSPVGNGKVSDDARVLGVQVFGITLLSKMPEPAPAPLPTPGVAVAPPPRPAGPIRLPAENVLPPGVKVWKGHDAGVGCGAVTPDGKTLVSGSWDGTVKVWDVAANAERKTFPNLAPKLSAIAITPDGSTFATADNDEKVRLWETATGKSLVELRAPVGQIANQALAFSPDGKMLAVAGGKFGQIGELLVWDWGAGKDAPLVEQPFKLRLGCLAFAPDGKQLAVGSTDGTVSVVDAGTGKLQKAFTLEKPVRGVAFSPEGKRLVAVHGDQGHVSLYEWQDGQKPWTFQDPAAKPLLSAAFSPDGKTLLTPHADGTALAWDVSAMPPQAPMPLLTGANKSWFALFFPDARTVAVGCEDGTIRLIKFAIAK